MGKISVRKCSVVKGSLLVKKVRVYDVSDTLRSKTEVVIYHPFIRTVSVVDKSTTL